MLTLTELSFSFNQDVSGWNVSNVTTMNWMFRNAESFSQDLCEWEVEQVEEYTNFAGGSAMSDAYLPRFGDPEATCPR